MIDQIQVVRIQTGMRIEKRMVKVLKTLAEYLGKKGDVRSIWTFESKIEV